MDGWTDGRMDGWMDGRMDGFLCLSMCIVFIGAAPAAVGITVLPFLPHLSSLYVIFSLSL